MLDVMIVGGGKMGQALAQGMLRSGQIEARQLGIVEVAQDGRAALEARFPDCRVLSESEASRSTVLAVKPGDMESLCRNLPSQAKNRVLSIAAGVPTAAVEVWLEGKTPVIRAMPNTAAFVGKAMTALCSGRYCGAEDMEWASALMSELGEVVIVKESLFDAVTAVSGSGPAYVFLVAEAMIDAAVAEGLPVDLATKLVTHTILGSGTLLVEGTSTATMLRQNVTSPGGTTAAALAVLESCATRAALAKAIKAAKERSAEIATELFKH